LQVLLAIKINS